MDLYETLGVTRDATDDDIKAAHRRKVKDTHPDAGGDAEAFDRVQTAYLVLRDPKRRARYDETGEVDTEADTERSTILQLISQAFLTVIRTLADDGTDLTQAPLIEHVRSWLKQHCAHIRKELGKGKVELAKLEALKGRFTGISPEHEGPPVLESILDSAIRPMRAALAAGEDALRRHEAALDILKGVDYRQDQKPPRQAPSYASEDLRSIMEAAHKAGLKPDPMYRGGIFGHSSTS